jgi:hypothetical protein
VSSHRELMHLAVALIATVADQTPAQGFDRRVIRRTDLAAMGAARMSDLIELAGATRSSVDGLTFTAALDRLPASGVSSPGMPTLTVLIDGIPIPSTALGQTMLEWLPVAIHEVDSVVVTPGPTTPGSVLAPRGTIAIYRTPARRGPTVNATLRVGDETGDPGPFRYTTESSPNVEKIGPFVDVTAAYGGRRLTADAGYARVNFNAGDSILLARFPAGALTAEHQYSALRSIRGGLAWRGGGDHRAVVSRTTHTGLVFVPPLGREQPVDASSAVVAVSGQVTRRSLTVAYTGNAANLDVNGFRSESPLVVGHERSSLFGSIDVARTLSRWSIAMGASGERQRVRMDTSGRDTSRATGRIHAALALGASTGARVSVGVGASIADNAAVDQHVDVVVPATTATTIHARFVGMQRIPESGAAWADRRVLGVASAEPPSVARFALGAEHRSRLRLAATGTVDRAWNWSVFAEPSPYAGGDPRDRSEVSGTATIVGTTLSAATTDSSRVVVSAFYDWSTIVSASEVMRDALQSTPRQEVRVVVRATPFASVRFAVTMARMSGTRWLSVDPATTLATTPPVERLDLSGEKWMWERRIRVQAVFRNVLNRPERYHPLGAQWNRRTLLTASFTLPRPN